ncbi:unnamed protein product, partial [Closterium sp. NIES-54]
MRQLWTAQDSPGIDAAVVARYSSPATAALGRLLLPYLFPELSAFATVEDLVSHLRTSDARHRATVFAKFLDRNQPPMFITLYFIVTHLPDSLRSIRDHFLSLVALHARPSLRGAPPPPLPPLTPLPLLHTSLMLRTSELLLLVQSAAAARARVARVVEGAVGVVVGAAVEVVEALEVVAAVGMVAGVGVLVAAVEAAVGVAAVAAVGLVAVGLALGAEALVVAYGSSNSVGARTSRPRSSTCGKLHTQHHCFSRLNDAWRAEFGDDVELSHWADLLRSRIAIFDLDFDAILTIMYALSVSAEGDCYQCVPPDPDIAAAALGASESSTLPGLHLPSFSTNLVSTAALQDAMVTTTTLGGQRVLICTCTRTGRHLVTFTRQPGSSLYTLATEPPQVAASAQVSASGQVAAFCSCRLLSHRTLLWHHRLGHPSLPRLRGMHSRLLVSGLPTSVPPLPPSPAPPCLPCVEGRQRAAPHSSSFPPTTAPLPTLHMDKWDPARVSGEGRERYFLLRFGQDLPVLRRHSDRGGEFSSNLLRDLCHGEGILQSFTLPDSPQQNGIAERCIGLVMELNLWPCVSFPENSPTLRWTGKVGDASVFRVWGSRAFVRDTSADKLSARAIPC